MTLTRHASSGSDPTRLVPDTLARDYRARAEALARIAPRAPQVAWWHAAAQWLLGDPEPAVQQFNRDALADCRDAGLLLHVVAALQATARAADALMLAARAHALAPAHRQARRMYCDLLLTAGQPEVARRILRSAIASEAFDPAAVIDWAQWLASSGRYRRAMRWLDHALRRNPDSFELARAAVRLALDRRDFEEALRRADLLLARWPDSVSACLLAGQVHSRCGDVEAAMNAYADAFDRSADDLDVLCAIAQTWLAVDNLAEASAWAQRARDIDPADRRVRRLLGEIFLDAGQHEDAIAELDSHPALRYDDDAQVVLARACWEHGDATTALDRLQAVRSRRPKLLGAQLWLAEILVSVGELSKATDLYREVLVRIPRHPMALSGLARCERAALAPELRGRMLDLLEAGHLAPNERAKLDFGLAHHFDALGDFASASRHLVAANAGHRQVLAARRRNYDADAFERHVDRLIAMFSHESLAAMPRMPELTPVPCFVIGMPRSGTTLTEQILAQHSCVVGVGEQSLALRGFQALSPEPADGEAGDAAEPWARLSPAVIAEHAARYHAELCRIARRFGGGKQPSHIVDKMPDNYQLLPWLLLLFPNARIVHVQRDPRDVALSCFMQQFGALHWANDLQHIAARIGQHQRLMQQWRTLLPGRFLEVRYERLCEAPEAEAERMLAWLGLEFEPGCLDFHEARRLVRTASVLQVREPVYRRSVARWRGYVELLAPVLADLDAAAARTEWVQTP